VQALFRKLFSESVYKENAYISICCKDLNDFCRRVFFSQYIKSNTILKTFLFQERSKKFLSCCQEFEPLTICIILPFSFALLKLNPSVVCGVHGLSLQEQVEVLFRTN